MSATSFECFEPRLPLALASVAADEAERVRPDNARRALEAAGERARFWDTGRVLRVLFLDGPELAGRVLAAAGAWTEHANLGLRLVDGGPAEIRVTFRGTGNWSVLGTEALQVAPDRPTMSLSGVRRETSAEFVKGVVRHEFGHAIGLVHEHSSPAAGIRWDEAAVLAALTGPPDHWSPEDVRQNVLDVHSRTTTNYTAFDPNSIMLYAFPAEWTLDGRVFGMNRKLSAMDEAFVREIYPGR